MQRAQSPVKHKKTILSDVPIVQKTPRAVVVPEEKKRCSVVLAFTIVALVVSFLCTYYGAMYFIDGSAALAKRFRVPVLVIGLTIVAFGTSVPEMFVAIVSYFKGVPTLSVGNLLGSSFADISLVLGIVALIRPIHIKVDFLRREFPFVIVAAVLLFLLASDGELTWGDGLILILSFCVYLYYTLIVRMLENKVRPSEEIIEEKELRKLQLLEAESKKVSLFYLFGGLITLLLGAHWLTDSAVTLARYLQVSDFVIGITLISFGTVLPELITGIMASVKGEEDIEVGNALGSFIFNILFIFGFFTLLQPIAIPINWLFFEIPVMLGVGILLIPLMRRNFTLGRLEGILLILIYLVYISKQILF